MRYNDEYIRKLYYESIFNLKHIEENIHLILYTTLCFFIPFILGHPQWLVGTLVNAALILGATYLRGYKLLPIILVPSIGVLTAGVIFGSFTWYLVYMIPAVWIGNAIFAYGYRGMHLWKRNYVLSILAPAVVKSLFLFSVAFILVKLSVLPVMFLTVMGVFQLMTAVLGGIVAIGVIETRKKISV
jgi:hypothetical protein